VFKPDINEQWYEIRVDASTTVSANAVNYEITGTDLASYELLTSSSFSITASTSAILAPTFVTF
jgi:hypothetical protein